MIIVADTSSDTEVDSLAGASLVVDSLVERELLKKKYYCNLI